MPTYGSERAKEPIKSDGSRGAPKIRGGFEFLPSAITSRRRNRRRRARNLSQGRAAFWSCQTCRKSSSEAVTGVSIVKDTRATRMIQLGVEKEKERRFVTFVATGGWVSKFRPQLAISGPSASIVTATRAGALITFHSSRLSAQPARATRCVTAIVLSRSNDETRSLPLLRRRSRTSTAARTHVQHTRTGEELSRGSHFYRTFKPVPSTCRETA